VPIVALKTEILAKVFATQLQSGVGGLYREYSQTDRPEIEQVNFKESSDDPQGV
jgi:hypothetical protein